MVPRTRVLIGSIAALLAWMLGYGMGGGFRIGGAGEAASRNASGKSSDGGGAQRDGTTIGIARPAVGTLEDQIAARRGKWTPERLRASFDAMGREPNLVHAIRFALKLTEQLGPDDFPMAIDAVNDVEGRADEEMMIFGMLALARWGDLNPAAAGEYLRANDKLGGKFIGPSEVELMLGSWAASNPLGAIAWVKSLKETDSHERGLKAIIATVARRDVDEAIALATAHAPELMKDGGLAEAIGSALRTGDPEKNVRKLAELGGVREIDSASRRWAEKNPEKAIEWAGQLTDEKLRTEALKGAWREFGEKHPEEAAAKLSQLAADAPFASGSVEHVTGRLAEKDPQAAARWAAALPQPEAQMEALGALGTFFGEKDPEQGGEWLDTLDAGSGRDRAVGCFVRKSKEKDPAAAAEWAVTILDSNERHEAVLGALNQWFSRNPREAMEWIQSSPTLSEEDRQAILKEQ